MKKALFTLPAVALSLYAAIVVSSCNNLDLDNISSNKTITIEFQQVDPEVPVIADEATRTGYHEKAIWWTVGDTVAFYQYATLSGAKKFTRSTYRVTTERETLPTITISFTEPDAETDAYYCSFFPKLSYNAYSTSSGNVRVRLTTPSTQTPTASKYDPNADLLISNYVENLTRNGEGKYSVKLAYFRQVALGKMRIVNLPSASRITSIVFKAEHDLNPVVLAGAKWYDFTTLGPTSTYSSSTTLTLDYSAQDIYGDMTAHFCCYPFELDADDWFDVIVTTEADEIFTRRVTLSALQSLTLEAGRATQFTVNMSSAVKTDSWITTKEYNSGSTVKTTYKICYSLMTTKTNVASGKFMAVTEDVFADISDISAYLDEHGTDLSATTVSGLNEGKTYTLSGTGLTGDTWCVGLVKLVLDDATVGVAITRVRTDWASLSASTRAAGGISYWLYGKDLASSTGAFRVIAKDGLPDGETYESYYNNTLPQAFLSSTSLDKINGYNGSYSTTGWYTTTYYTGASTTGTMTKDTEYTVMIKVTNLRGETKLLTAIAKAGGE